MIAFIAALLLQVEAPTAPPPSAPIPSATPTQPEPAKGLYPVSLHLICRGTGERSITNLSFGSVFTRRHSASVIGGTTSQDQFGEQMDIEVNGQSGRVRVPRRFLPPLHGGDAGWFDVKDLVVGDEAITGKVMINYANHPDMRIDRRSGSVALDGKVGSFAGQCEAYDANKRAF